MLAQGYWATLKKKKKPNNNWTHKLGPKRTLSFLFFNDCYDIITIYL